MITHKGTQTLYTDRLILRRFTVEDARAMFDHWASDERVTRYLTWTPHESPEATKQLLTEWCAAYANEAYYNWAMELDGKLIGNISVVRFDEESEHAELGYCMGYDDWNKGFMTEAAKAVIGFLFRETGLNRIGIVHALKNPASGKVAQKCGLTYEGTKRQYYKNANGEFFDIAFYSILKSEWKG